MKVSTLTLPIHVNYGAVLQAYALHQALINAGHEPVLLDIRPSIYKKNNFLSLISFTKNYISRLIKKDTEYGNESFKQFVEKNIRKTSKTRFHFQLARLAKSDAYVVGSDQVWRSEYALNIELFYLDFVRNGALKLSYAASFGKADWSYSSLQTENCKTLLKDFDAVSVREFSGKTLVEEKLDGEATHVLDPTMIIDVEKYNKLIESNSDKKFGYRDLFCYVLDINREKQNLISLFCKEQYLNENLCNKGKVDKDKMSIENWLQGIRDSHFVITDSFHGMVFCILFEKEFLVLANNSRGYERFSSLLGQLGISERLVDENMLNQFSSEKLSEIDYKIV
ncbi:polysaccharide pyruvyl transferase family protein, partial [Vibrio lentus]